MMNSVNHSIGTLKTINLCREHKQKVEKQAQKISSGMKIVGAEDGAAEYTISEKMQVLLYGLGQDIDNLKQGMQVTQAASGGLSRIMDILRNMKEKAIHSANDTNTDADRQSIQQEVNQMLDQIDDIAKTTEGNGVLPLYLGGVFGAADGYSSRMGKIEVATYGGYRVFDAEEPSRFLLSLEGTFSSKLRVSDGNKAVALELSAASSAKNGIQMTIHHDKTVTYKYNKNGISFEVYQSYELIREEGEFSGYEAYNLIYQFKNTGSGSLTYDIALPVDPISGQMNIPQINSAQEADKEQKRYNATDIAQGACEALLCNPDIWPVICNATARISGDRIYQQPDAVVVGDAYFTRDWNYIDGSLSLNKPVFNYHYTPAWLNKTVGAGQSYTVNTIMGVTYPMKEGVAKDGSHLLRIQSGTHSNQDLYIKLCNATTKNLGIKNLDLTTAEKASSLLSSDNKTGPIDLAIKRVGMFNNRFGAYQKRMEYNIENVTVQNGDVTESESTIRDADISKEAVVYQKEKVLQDASQSMLAKINEGIQSLLRFLE